MPEVPELRKMSAALRSAGATLALAESCTGGLISSHITDLPGSSGYFLGSAVTYSNISKNRVLGVSQDTLSKYGAVSEQTAIEMAEGAATVFISDFSNIYRDSLFLKLFIIEYLTTPGLVAVSTTYIPSPTPSLVICVIKLSISGLTSLITS